MPAISTSKIFNDYNNIFCAKRDGGCSDRELTHITWAEWNSIVTKNIKNDKNKVNEIFSPCYINLSLHIRSDAFGGYIWVLEKIIE